MADQTTRLAQDVMDFAQDTATSAVATRDAAFLVAATIAHSQHLTPDQFRTLAEAFYEQVGDALERNESREAG